MCVIFSWANTALSVLHPNGLGFIPWFFARRNVNRCVQKGHICIVWELLSGFGFGSLCICAYVLCDLPLLAIPRAGWRALSLIICELFVTNYNQCSWNDWLGMHQDQCWAVPGRWPQWPREWTRCCPWLWPFLLPPFLSHPSLFPSLGDQFSVQRRCLVDETDL